MYLLDQHAAHERVLFEKVKANYYKNEEKDVQVLLLPDIITLSYRENELAHENKDVFNKAGFEFEEFGINTVKLTAVPSMCEVLNTKELFLDILDEILSLDNPFTCPHGRPTAIKISLYDLERKFSRK